MTAFENTFERPQGRAAERLRAVFTEIEDVEDLLRPRTMPAAARRVAASSLYAAAQTGAADSNPALKALLSGSRAARGFHSRAVADSARFTVPETRAASSRRASARHGEGCHIRIERSRAEPDQFFVVVEMAKDASPTSLVVCDHEDRCRRFALPMVRDGIAQIIAEANSDLLRLIGDPTTRVYLR